jgi:hypothetical protein
MTGWSAILVPGVSGAAITLLGVITGGAIASRSQQRQWARDKQIDGCAAVIQESARMQLALRERWTHGQETDWTAWNQALSMLWLVGTSDVITQALWLDRAFWLCGARINNRQITDEDTWAVTRDYLESARLDFINTARRRVVNAKTTVNEVPVARPPLSEIQELFGSAPDHPPFDDDHSGQAS